MEQENDIPTLEDTRKLGFKLLWLVKSKKRKDAENLLKGEENIDVGCQDEAGWYTIHYAAAEGYTDVLIALVDKGVDVNVKDLNGETPLHKCSRRGHMMCILALVSHGAKITKCDKQGQTPLEIAVISKKLEAVQLFMKVGAEPSLQDWAWSMDDLDGTQTEILELLINQHTRMPGFKYGSILQTLLYMKEETIDLDIFGVKIVPDSPSSPFYLHVCKLTTEYSDIMENLKDEQETFSDCYEITIWGQPKHLQGVELDLNVIGITECSEKLYAVRLEGKPVKVVKWEKFEDDDVEDGGHTVVTVKLQLDEKKMSRFAIVKQTTPEIFTVSGEQTTLTLQMEPEASIDIPKGTFEEPSEIAVNIVETKEVNKEEEEGQAILMTNVLEMTLANRQQPKEPIRVVIPIHGDDMTSDGEVVVLASLVEQPEEESDWEVKEATISPNRKTAFFYVNHFSFYSVAMKSKILKDKADVVSALDRSINKKKRVIFFLMTKWVNVISSELVIECTVIRHVENRISCWSEAGYDVNTLQKSEVYPIQVGEIFKIKFHGNLVETSGVEFHEITFQNNRNNYHVFNIGVHDSGEPSEGGLKIIEEREEVFYKQEPVMVKSVGLFRCNSVEPEVTETKETKITEETVFDMKVLLIEKMEIVEEPEEDDNQSGMKKFASLTQTIMRGGKPIDVVAIKSKKKSRTRVH